LTEITKINILEESFMDIVVKLFARANRGKMIDNGTDASMPMPSIYLLPRGA
jgi:hypothetical protein